MTTPRRYVRVRMITHHGALAEWQCRMCGERHIRWTADFAHLQAREHAEDCGHIAAMERDWLRDELDRMRADRNRLRDRLHQFNPLSKDTDR